MKIEIGMIVKYANPTEGNRAMRFEVVDTTDSWTDTKWINSDFPIVPRQTIPTADFVKLFEAV